MMLNKEIQKNCGKCLNCFVNLLDSYILEKNEDKLNEIEKDIINSLEYIKKEKHPSAYNAFSHTFNNIVMMRERHNIVLEKYAKISDK
jgi:radical SAM superfamily enzyme